MCRNATWRSEAFHVSDNEGVLVYVLEGAVRQRSNDSCNCVSCL